MALRSKELEFGMKCIKYMLCMASAMFVIVGLLLISIGYTIKTIYDNFDEFMAKHYYDPSSLAIAIGFIIFIIALFGVIGALKESTCLVNTFAFFLTIILVLEISVCIAAFAMRNNIAGSIDNNMKYAMEHYDKEYNAFTWNSTQSNLQCCGVYNYTEWSQYAERNFSGFVNIPTNTSDIISVPTSCCLDEQCDIYTVFGSGCLYRLSYIISQCAMLLAIGALCVSFIQVLGIIFAAMLAKSIRKVKTHILVDREKMRRNFYDQIIKNQEHKPQIVELYTPKDSDA